MVTCEKIHFLFDLSCIISKVNIFKSKFFNLKFKLENIKFFLNTEIEDHNINIETSLTVRKIIQANDFNKSCILLSD